jgi:hypothetical protein
LFLGNDLLKRKIGVDLVGILHSPQLQKQSPVHEVHQTSGPSGTLIAADCSGSAKFNYTNGK